MTSKKVKFVEADKSKIYVCQLTAVGYCGNRFELEAVYRASLAIFGKTLPLFQIVTACRERQAALDASK